MIGVITNAVAVVLGSALGLLFKKGISQKITDALMIGVGLCIICIGITGMLDGKNILVIITSVVLGTIAGTLIDIDKRFNSMGEWVQAKFKKKDSSGTNVAEGFVTASLLFCVGSMAIVGSIDAGINKNYEILFTKSILDCICAMMFSVSLGIGVMLSSVAVLVYEGLLVLLALFLEKPLLASGAMGELNCVGSILIFALGLNLIKVAKIKVANFLPSLFIVPFVAYFFNWLAKIGVLNF